MTNTLRTRIARAAIVAATITGLGFAGVGALAGAAHAQCQPSATFVPCQPGGPKPAPGGGPQPTPVVRIPRGVPHYLRPDLVPVIGEADAATDTRQLIMKNIGKGDAQQPFLFDLKDSQGKVIWEQTISSLAGDTEVAFTVQNSLFGCDTYTAVADPTDVIEEVDETNNTAQAQICTPPPAPAAAQDASADAGQ